jgi:hypothetical protein
MFWTIFLAVLSALLTMRAIHDLSRSHRRWKGYCEAQAEEHNRLMNHFSDKGNQEMAEMHAKYYRLWKKDAKSWWGLR